MFHMVKACLSIASKDICCCSIFTLGKCRCVELLISCDAFDRMLRLPLLVCDDEAGNIKTPCILFFSL